MRGRLSEEVNAHGEELQLRIFFVSDSGDVSISVPRSSIWTVQEMEAWKTWTGCCEEETKGVDVREKSPIVGIKVSIPIYKFQKNISINISAISEHYLVRCG